ncbi:hypothetical protein EDD85DRAFT_943027 [Armillaria nabsnona]|nr:hypothetical protein EDD85DRAFT_943027 [Armillaria nabsnona]
MEMEMRMGRSRLAAVYNQLCDNPSIRTYHPISHRTVLRTGSATVRHHQKRIRAGSTINHGGNSGPIMSGMRCGSQWQPRPDPADERESPETPHTHPGNLASHGTLAKNECAVNVYEGARTSKDTLNATKLRLSASKKKGKYSREEGYSVQYAYSRTLSLSLSWLGPPTLHLGGRLKSRREGGKPGNQRRGGIYAGNQTKVSTTCQIIAWRGNCIRISRSCCRGAFGAKARVLFTALYLGGRSILEPTTLRYHSHYQVREHVLLPRRSLKSRRQGGKPGNQRLGIEIPVQIVTSKILGWNLHTRRLAGNPKYQRDCVAKLLLGAVTVFGFREPVVMVDVRGKSASCTSAVGRSIFESKVEEHQSVHHPEARFEDPSH